MGFPHCRAPGGLRLSTDVPELDGALLPRVVPGCCQREYRGRHTFLERGLCTDGGGVT